jgi:aerobic carbon-monoxide dehydrogenase small subunit
VTATGVYITLRVNCSEYELELESRTLLVDAIRDYIGLTGTHIGCDSTSCGACTVLMDGRAVKSCTIFAPQAEGSDLTTVEGLARDGHFHPLQQAFEEYFAFQCGYCTAGMLMSALALYEREQTPSREDIRSQLVGNLCRCTGYEPIVEAIEQAIAAKATP